MFLKRELTRTIAVRRSSEAFNPEYTHVRLAYRERSEREKSKKATGAPLTASGVLTNQAPAAQKTTRESQLMTESVKPAPKEGSETVVKPKKNKPRPSKSYVRRVKSISTLDLWVQQCACKNTSSESFANDRIVSFVYRNCKTSY